MEFCREANPRRKLRILFCFVDRKLGIRISVDFVEISRFVYYIHATMKHHNQQKRKKKRSCAAKSSGDGATSDRNKKDLEEERRRDARAAYKEAGGDMNKAAEIFSDLVESVDDPSTSSVTSGSSGQETGSNSEYGVP